MQKGTFIRISYTGRVKETGEMFDTTDKAVAAKEGALGESAHYGPVPVIVGENRVVKGLDEALAEMKVGESRSVEVVPEKAFGIRGAHLTKILPQAEFKKNGFDPAPGMPVAMGNIRGKIMSVSGGRVKVDFNHPLAGKTLVYDVKVEKELTEEKEKVTSIVEFFTGLVPEVKMGEQIEIITEELPAKAKQMITDDINRFIAKKDVKFSQVVKAENKEKPAQ